MTNTTDFFFNVTLFLMKKHQTCIMVVLFYSLLFNSLISKDILMIVWCFRKFEYKQKLKDVYKIFVCKFEPSHCLCDNISAVYRLGRRLMASRCCSSLALQGSGADHRGRLQPGRQGIWRHRESAGRNPSGHPRYA